MKTIALFVLFLMFCGAFYAQNNYSSSSHKNSSKISYLKYDLRTNFTPIEVQPNRTKPFSLKDDEEYYSLDSLIWSSITEGIWQDNSKDEYEYDANGNILVIRSAYVDWEQTGWLYNSMSEYEYDNENYVTSEIQSYWDSESNDWLPSSRIVNTYAENHQLANTTSSTWNSTIGIWIPSYSTDYTYNENGYLIQALNKQWNYVYWVNSYKSEIEYDSNNLEILQTNYSWDNEWILSDKSEKAYDELGHLTVYTYYYWNIDLNQWDNSYRYEQSYDIDGNMIQYLEFYWDNENEQWQGNSKTEMLFNKENQLTEKLVSFFDYEQHIWTYYDKYEYAYDMLGNIISSTYYNTGGVIWEKETEWTPSSLTEYTYENEYPVSDLFVPPTYEYNYKITQVNDSYWNEDTWENSYKGTYYYSLVINSGICSSTHRFELMIYPNPTAHLLNIEWNNGIIDYEMVIYNESGQAVFAESIQNRFALDVRDFAKGVYYVRLSNKHLKAESVKRFVVF